MFNVNKKLEAVKTKWAAKTPDERMKLVTAGLGVAAAAVSLTNAVTKLNNSRTWRREVKRREQLSPPPMGRDDS